MTTLGLDFGLLTTMAVGQVVLVKQDQEVLLGQEVLLLGRDLLLGQNVLL